MKELERILPKDRVSREPDLLFRYAKDWTDGWQTRAEALVFPENIAEVQTIVRWAGKNKVGLVPSGGRTGMSGGAVALHGEVILSLERMNRMRDFNSVDQTVVCEAGVITENLQKFAESQGLYYPVDFGSRGSSHIGGNIATNAGGIRVLRYGCTRNWVWGLKAVIGNGEILDCNRGLVKNATGYDFRHLFIGSEGSLGVIVEATMKLTQLPEPQKVILFAVNGLETVTEMLAACRKTISLYAFEMFSELALQHVVARNLGTRPFSTVAPYYVLVEYGCASAEEEAKMTELFAHFSEKNWVQDAVTSESSEQARQLWGLRENISEALSGNATYKNDISVTPHQVPDFVRELEKLLAKQYPDFAVVCFGHIGDGNLHINILKPADWDEARFLHACRDVDPRLYGLVERFAGSISAEHGVGIVKKDFLPITRSGAEVELMKAIKKSFDPVGILNPGKLF